MFKKLFYIIIALLAFNIILTVPSFQEKQAELKANVLEKYENVTKEVDRVKGKYDQAKETVEDINNKITETKESISAFAKWLADIKETIETAVEGIQNTVAKLNNLFKGDDSENKDGKTSDKKTDEVNKDNQGKTSENEAVSEGLTELGSA